MPEQFEFQLWIVQAVLSELALIRVDLFGRDGSLLLPVSKSDNKVSINAPSAWSLIGVSKRHLLSPASELDLLVAVLNHDSVDLGSIKIDHVLRLTPASSVLGPLHFEKSEISDAG